MASIWLAGKFSTHHTSLSIYTLSAVLWDLRSLHLFKSPVPSSSFRHLASFINMKLFNWMHNKLNTSKAKNKSNSISATLDEPSKDEFSDWPQAFLAIGTFGNNNLKDDSGRIIAEHSSCSRDGVQKLTPDEEEEEEEEDFQNELKMCLREESPADHMNNCSDSENKETLFPNSSLIPYRGKDLCLDNSMSGMGKKSLTFLLKKIFVCKSGFQSTPSFKDPPSAESRMEKILRAILNKKVYPQGTSSAMIIKKYLEEKEMAKSDNDEDEFSTAADDGSKWVKTDSELIAEAECKLNCTNTFGCMNSPRKCDKLEDELGKKSVFTAQACQKDFRL